MLEKGYSQRLTNNVLSELNSRAQQITQLMGSPPDSQTHQQQARASTNNQVMNRRNKRYSGIHMNKFKQMDSINQHYSVHVRTPSPQKTDTLSNPPEESASKRRRTLNGNDEIVAIPVMQKKETIKEVSSSPMRKISPSKGSMNLNSMLRHTTETGSPNKEEFVKPFPPSLRLRKSSLELAGVEQRFVKPLPFNLTKKSSIPQLNKKASIPQLNKKSSIPQLNKKSSIPTLNKKSSIPNINRSISSHIPQPSTAAPPLPPPHGSYLPSLQKKASSPQLSRSTPHLTRVSPSRSFNNSASSRSVNSRILSNTTNLPSTMTKSKSVTIPQPFSLYDKPTISSSQKSLNKFQKFREKFT
ncbi:hypothetical protein SBY92_002569 [Candida maltosa Xu316]